MCRPSLGWCACRTVRCGDNIACVTSLHVTIVELKCDMLVLDGHINMYCLHEAVLRDKFMTSLHMLRS